MEGKTLKNMMEERLQKLKDLRKMGMDPFVTTKFGRTHMAGDIVKKFGKIAPDEKLEKEKVSIAGRIRAIRRHGGSAFFDLEDFSGQIQVLLSLDTVGKEAFDIFGKVDIGDMVGVSGYIFKTKKGELSVWSKEFTLLAKSLRPLPSNWFGLKDVETRYRERYVDLIMNKDARDVLIKRSRIVSAMREFLDGKGFIEVTTPILQPIYGGALARPFVTHHNALNRDLYLRIADELYLKKLIVGGLEKVYEIGPDFRNEGVDTRHNPEFSMMEFYQVYIDFNQVADVVEEMLTFIAQKVMGGLNIRYKDHDIDLKRPWLRISMLDAIKKYAGVDIEKESAKGLIKILKERKIEVDENCTKGDLMMVFFEEIVQPQLIQPTFVFDHPIEISPLAKKKPGNPDLTERFELFIGTEECANAFSEINDPIDQKERFRMQAQRRKKGDEEAHPIDEDYIRALEYGMPPTGGVGIGIERLAMVLTNSPSIRDVILFPQLREGKGEVKEGKFGDKDSDNVVKSKEKKKSAK